VNMPNSTKLRLILFVAGALLIMIESLSHALLWIAAVGAGLMAGVYFAFSGFIMRSLDRLDAANAVDTMNAINEVILRSWFMPLFFGTSLLYLVLALQVCFDWSGPNAPLLLTAGLTYFGGMFLCTIIFNVPLNNRLAKVKEDDIDKIQLWSHYYKYWTRWNHLRTASSLMACVLSIYLLTTYP
jgi:uncharacterized membrane protein